MLDAVDEVEHEREAQQELDTAVDNPGHSSERGRKARALEVPAEEWRGEVSGEVEVGAAGEEAAGDTGPGGGAEPGLGELVDAEMGRDGAVEALVDEDLVALILGDLGRCDLAVRIWGLVPAIVFVGVASGSYRAEEEVVMPAAIALAMFWLSIMLGLAAPTLINPLANRKSQRPSNPQRS